jgi:diacylglycerol kinase family enzyme
MKIVCIINPESGRDCPILSKLDRFFKEQKIDWDVYVFNTERAKNISGEGFDYAVVYGGDGTLTETIRHINIPILPLQGGTANLIAKAVNIPEDIGDALKLLKKHKTKSFDSFSVNGKKYFLRAYTGPPATSMKKVKRDEKKTFGEAAYINALLKSIKYEPRKYTVTIDGEKEEIKTNIFLVSNFASIGLGEFKIDERMDPADGKLDLLCINDALTLSRSHKQFEKLTVKTDKKLTWSVDGNFPEFKEITFEVNKKDVKLIIP